jgi:hypothetical protein
MRRALALLLVPARFASLLLLAVVSCGGLASQLRAAATESCPDVLGRDPAVRGDARYAQEPAQERSAYELAVAECDLQARRPQAALDLADAWHDAVAVRRDKIRVRALAMLKQTDALRDALGTLSGETELTPEYFIDTVELGPFEASDWLLSVALQTWQRHPGRRSLHQFAGILVRNGGGQVVDLAVVSAQASHATGDWAAWTGKARGARVDREGNRTVVDAEGVDVDEGPRQQGMPFSVRFAHADERLVHVGTFTAFGRYAGRDSNGAPLLDALIVIELRSQP